MLQRLFIGVAILLTGIGSLWAGDSLQDTLPELKNGQAPGNFEQMWAGFDPRAEPLEVQTLKQWEEDGVVMRIVRFRIGVFKGRKAMLAAIYGFPKSAEGGIQKLPGLVQIHGGGQYADYRACLTNAKRGYATVSLAWAGRINAPNYHVTPKEVKLFWDNKTDDPDYKLTTDWGAVEGYHAPCRNPGNVFPSAKPAAWTLDAVESPRNSGWYLCALAARRALTFLEQQPEADPNRLGVYGHSMGGKLTVMTAVDPRVKAAAPSCGGISDRYNDSPLFRATIGDDVSLKHISCPLVFLSPANDFHGRLGDLPKAIHEISSNQWRVTCEPHHNHQDTAEYEVLTQLWFDQYLKGTFKLPQTPKGNLKLNTGDGVPTFIVQPDASKPIDSVDIYYTQQGKPDERPEDREDTMHRFWHHARATDHDGRWTANLPLHSTDKPLWVYANVMYRLDHPITGAGYYYIYTTSSFNLSSLLQVASPEALKSAGCRATLKPSPLIDNFEGDWKKEWFTNNPDEWAITTNKLHDDRWKAPQNAKLAFKGRAAEANTLVVLIDDYGAEVKLQGGPQWQDVALSPENFQDAAGKTMSNWQNIRQLKLSPAEHLKPKRGDTASRRLIGKQWKGSAPEFHDLRWQLPDTTPDAAQLSMLDVFPKSIVQMPDDRLGSTVVSSGYTPSGSLWDKRLDEKDVFQVEISHQQDVDNSFKLRVGKGGQIYSLRGRFGESVPPSYRAGNSRISPWNDEVWQFVAVCSRYNQTSERMSWLQAAAPYRTGFFVHGSGCYADEAEGDTWPIYCPLLASDYEPATRSYRQLNWGLVPQARTIHRSPLLYYSQVRDVGNGVIELTWVVHNFSVRDDIVFNHLNTPWGGTRVSSLPLHYVSTPKGDLELDTLDKQRFAGGVDVRQTGGFALSSQSSKADSPSLALVYGLDQHLESGSASPHDDSPGAQRVQSIYRSWRAGAPHYEKDWADFKDRPANSFRNFDVVEVIRRVRIQPHSSMWFRSYLVVGPKDQCRRIASNLVGQVGYGTCEFNADSSPLVRTGANPSVPAMKLYAHPVKGTLPLFALRNKLTGKVVCTTDPYYFTPQKKLALDVLQSDPDYGYYSQAMSYALDGQTEFLSLLGFGYQHRPAEPGWRKLSELIPADISRFASMYDVDLWVKPVTP